MPPQQASGPGAQARLYRLSARQQDDGRFGPPLPCVRVVTAAVESGCDEPPYLGSDGPSDDGQLGEERVAADGESDQPASTQAQGRARASSAVAGRLTANARRMAGRVMAASVTMADGTTRSREV